MKKRPIKDFALGIYDGPHATPKEADDGPVFLGIKNVTEDGRLDFSEIRHVSEEEFPKWTKRVTPQKDDVVFSYEATLHLYAIIPEGFHGCLGRRMALVRPDTSKVDPRFLHYYFLSPKWRAVVEGKIIVGATVNRIPLKDFPDFEVEFPSLPEQKEISRILSNYDDLIENNRRRIQLLEESARLLYREWFVHLRFPGHEHVKVVAGVPQGWKDMPLPDAVEINPRTPVEKNKAITYVPMSSLSETGMTVDVSDFEIRENHTNVKFIRNDTLLARITPCLENGKTAFVYFLNEGDVACGSTEFIVLREKQLSPEYIYCLSRSYEFREHAIKSMTGSSGRQRVQVSAFNDYYVYVPPKGLMEQFNEFAGNCFAQIKLLTRQNAQLANARDVLLPRLMNGDIAV